MASKKSKKAKNKAKRARQRQAQPKAIKAEIAGEIVMSHRGKLATALAQVAALTADLRSSEQRVEVLNGRIISYEGTITRLNENISRHQEGAQKSRQSISDLKAALRESEINAARLQGYADRALEDDAVREMGAGEKVPMMPEPDKHRRLGPAQLPGIYLQDAGSYSRRVPEKRFNDL